VSGLRLEQVHVADPATVFDAFTDPDAQHELYDDAPTGSPGEVGAALLDAARQAFTHGLHVTSGLSAALAVGRAVLATVLLGRR
jgi:hypothetical protein